MSNGGTNSTTGSGLTSTTGSASTGGTGAGTGMGVTAGPGNAAGALGPSCDVAPIFQQACGQCHGTKPQFGAPMSLVTYEDFQGNGVVTQDQTILELIGARIHDAQRPMPPSGMLTDQEKAAIDGWLAAGAPSNNGQACGAGAGGDAGALGDGGTAPYPQERTWPPPDADECYTLVAHGNGGKDTPMNIEAGAETHPQVIFDAPWGDEQVQAVGFRPITDNTKVLHHWILYENSGVGAFIVGWAPGNEGRDLPEDVGMYVPSGPGSLRLDLHYYNRGGGTAETDQSGVEICVRKGAGRPNTATVTMSFSNFLFSLPPGEDTDVEGYCKLVSDTPVTAMSVSPHMHEYAYHSKLEVKRAATGQVEVWHEGPFNFEDQQIYDLDDRVLHNGDVVKTTCRFRNTSNAPVTFGENTGDEMCFNFVTYYPMGSFSCDLLGGLIETF